jgi:energy-coupling factor transport system permease protein
MRVATTGMLDRALDVAAALEVRGYGVTRRPPHTRKPYSRHDFGFTASAAAIVALAICTRVLDLAPLNAYPTLRIGTGAGTLVAAGALLAAALLPFADPRGIER